MAREAADERADRDAALEPGERRAEAVVDAAAERHVLAGRLAVEAELVGVVAELGGVAVGRAEAGHHEVARLEGVARPPSTGCSMIRRENCTGLS